MGKHGVQGALIVQRADLFYFSGTGQDAHLFVPVEGSAFLLVRKSLERALLESPLEDIRPLVSFSDLKRCVENVCHGPLKSLGMELDVLPVNNFRLYTQLFPDTDVMDVSPFIREVRMVKSAFELEQLREAARVNDEMFANVGEILREGMSEIEFAGLVEAFVRAHGHQGYCRVRSFNQEVFFGHILSGSNLAIPTASLGPTGGPGPNPSMPQGAGFKTIARHEPVQVDYLGSAGGYMVDQARTFFIGEPPAKFLKIHDVALAIQNAVAASGVPGARSESLYQLAVDMAEESGFSKGFMGYSHPVSFVGHGIGLEVDELPVIGRKSPHILKNGMVFAVEPKFIVPGEGLAGIENTFVVTEHGLERITRFPDEIRIIP